MFLIITKALWQHTFIFWHRSRAKYFLTQLSSCQLPEIVSREAELITDDCSGYSNGQSFIALVLWASYPNLFIFRRLPVCQVTFPHMNQSVRKVATLPLKLLMQNRANFTTAAGFCIVIIYKYHIKLNDLHSHVYRKKNCTKSWIDWLVYMVHFVFDLHVLSIHQHNKSHVSAVL